MASEFEFNVSAEDEINESLLQSVDELDRVRGNYFATMSSFYLVPTKKRSERVQVCVQASEAVLSASVDIIVQSEDTLDVKVDMLQNIFWDEVDKRLEFVADITESNPSADTTEERLDFKINLATALKESGLAGAQYVKNEYNASLAADTESLTSYAQYAFKANMVGIGKVALASTKDVAKIGLGVFIGITAAQYLQSKITKNSQ